jgi:uncharacterized FlaG/YvyC family protein
MAVTALHAGSFESLPPSTFAPKPASQTLDVGVQKPENPRPTLHPEAPDQETLDNEIAFANSVAELFDKKVSFSYDNRIKQVVVKVVQEGTEEVIRQIPAEEMIALRLRLKENFQGIILNQKS